MSTTHTDTTTAAAVIADGSDPDAVREASVTMAVAAAVRLRHVADSAALAAAQLTTAAGTIIEGEDAGDVLASADTLAAAILVEAREARQALNLAVEGDDLAGGRRGRDLAEASTPEDAARMVVELNAAEVRA